MATEDDVEPLVRVIFELGVDEDGWPPVSSERLWARRLGPDTARVDNIPFFVRELAVGDVVRFRADDQAVLVATEVVEPSDNCTIRVVPLKDSRCVESRQAVLDAFAPLGVDGEGVKQWGVVALNVPADADLEQVKRLLIQGQAAGRWDFEEGCVTAAWRAVAG